MADLAELGLRIHSQEVDTADKRLDALQASAQQAENATDSLAAAARGLGSALLPTLNSIDATVKEMLELQRAQQQIVGQSTAQAAATAQVAAETQKAAQTIRFYGASFQTAQSSMGGAAAAAKDWGQAIGLADAHVQAYQAHLATLNTTMVQQDAHVAAYRRHLGQVQTGFRLTATEGLNLSRQMADIGVTAAMGMNPLMIALQQGPQLFDIFQAAAIRAGTTIRAAMVATGAAVWTALAPLLPVLAGIAVTAGTIAAAFGLATRSIRESTGDVAASMGLAKEQLERVKDAGVSTSVTIGDTFKATFQEIGANIAAVMKPATDWLADTWGVTLDSITEAAATGTQAVLAFFVGTYRAVLATWRNFPAAFGDMVIQGANAAITALNGLINRAVDGLNWLDAKFAGGRMQIAHFTATLLDNPVAGAAAADAAETAEIYQKAFADVGAAMDNFGANVRRRAIENRRDAIREAAGDPNKGREGGKSEAQRLTEETERYIQSLRDQAATLGMNAIAAKEYEIAQRAAKAASVGLNDEVEEAGRLLLEKMRIEAADLRSKNDQLETIRAERSLIGATNRERAVALAQLAEIQRLRRAGVDPNSALGRQAVDLAGDVEGERWDKDNALDRYNDSLQLTLDLARQADDIMRDAARGFADAWGDAGSAIGDVLTNMSGLNARLAEIEERRDTLRRQGMLSEARAAELERDRAAATIGAYGDMLSAARGYFQEGSDGYRVMLAIEQAYRAYQLASAIQAMAIGGQETAMSVSNSLAKGAASAAAGAAKMFEFLGPLGFPAVAAMLGLLAGLGLAGGGGGSGAQPSAANDNTNPESATNAVRSYAEQQAQAQEQATASMAQAVRVQIELNDPMFTARVQKEAAGVAAPMAATAAAGAKADVMRTLERNQQTNRRVKG